MREIKFRFWDNAFECYVPHDDLSAFTNPTIVSEQFTGLHDSKGREIYENDIVEYFDMPEYRKRYKVEFGYFSFDGGHYRYQYQGFGLVPIRCDDKEDHWRLIEGDIEVIGNIHESE